MLFGISGICIYVYEGVVYEVGLFHSVSYLQDSSVLHCMRISLVRLDNISLYGYTMFCSSILVISF